jgi:hypothetical protein
VGAGSNTSTIALRVVGGEGKGTQCPRLQLGQPVSGGYKYGDLALQLGKSEAVKYGVESCGTRTCG